MKLSREVLDRISGLYGQSFYLLDAERFIHNYESLLSSFKLYYPNTNIAYSYKTNYIPRFCKIVNEHGGFAEVVSDMELQIALNSGVQHKHIFFNGPYKSKEAMEKLLLGGGVVNADSICDLRNIGLISEKYPEIKMKIGLRCNFDVEDGVVSRFGFDVENGAFGDAKRFIKSMPNLQLVGLHCHFARRTLETWSNRTKGMLKLIAEHMGEGEIPLQYVSLGGGMYGNMPESLREQFDDDIPNFDDYARVAAKPFAEFFSTFDKSVQPVLIIEPGTALAADSMKFAANVIDIKNVQNKIIATLGGSIYNINPTPNRKNLPISVYPKSTDSAERKIYSNVDFGGYTCIESDYLYRGFSGQLMVGDYVVFDDVGAYSVVMKPPFILPNFAIVEYDDECDQVALIKRQEDVADLFITYV